MKSLFVNWKTLICGALAFSVVPLIWLGKINAEQGVALLGGVGTLFGIFGKDGDKGSNAPSSVADAVVRSATQDAPVVKIAPVDEGKADQFEKDTPK